MMESHHMIESHHMMKSHHMPLLIEEIHFSYFDKMAFDHMMAHHHMMKCHDKMVLHHMIGSCDGISSHDPII